MSAPCLSGIRRNKIGIGGEAGCPATVNPPASVPKWEIVALEDHAIPAQAEFYMAKRAGARIVTANSGHDVPAARPGVVDSVILQAVQSVS